jgi:cytochrome b6-f complex iron-sulfur subunit
MAEILKAMSVSAAILLPVVILMIIVSILAVNRGAKEMHGGVEPHHEAAHASAEPSAVAGTAAKAAPKGAVVPRREFLSWMNVAWAAFAASMLAVTTASARFMFPNVLFEPPSSFKAGFPNEIQVGEVDEKFKPKGVWLVRDSQGIYALSTICTHLGCTPNWLEAEQKFKCPCHGSGYYKSGINFEGPTPRPLERFAISLADDCQILVDKSHKFQYEKGEWTNPAAFLKYS